MAMDDAERRAKRAGFRQGNSGGDRCSINGFGQKGTRGRIVEGWRGNVVSAVPLANRIESLLIYYIIPIGYIEIMREENICEGQAESASRN